MQLLKKNILSILCGVVALIGVIAVFYPIGPMYEKANAALAERKETHTKISTLLTTPRVFPTLTEEEGGEPTPLDRFPSPEVIKAGKAATDKLQDQAKAMLEAAVNLNRHKPLHDSALPGARGESAANFTFRDWYLDRVNVDLPNKVLRSGVPPTNEEIQAAAEKLWFDRYAERIVLIGDEPDVEQLEALHEEYLAEADKLPEQMRVERARKIKVYMEPDALAVSPEVSSRAEDRPPAAADIWYAQVALWLQEDLAKAVAALNGGKVTEVDPATKKRTQRDKNVTDSPVKQIIAFDIEFGPGQFVMKKLAAGGMGGEGDAPADDASAVGEDGRPKEFELSPTGRACNEVYDVVHFTTVLRVDATQVPLVLDELRRDKFITPIDVDVSTVDAARALEEGYVYCEGTPKPIVDLTIQCEALFLREWTKPLMPKLVQEDLGIGNESEAEGEEGEEEEARAPAGFTTPSPDRLARRD